MKPLADNRKTIVAVPIILKIVQVQITLSIIPAEIRDITITVIVGPKKYAECHRFHHPLTALGIESCSGSLNPPTPGAELLLF